ncbi:hypothetical protein [Pelagibacterium luteolum]|uniref:Uncharacterized protein n=1 Tax=Pelagibacterium luteolum TaxID=440168 RepID=A0A1G8AR60_9HYPH|nr:hypothetical protein [Pelagibacterium luteolum]SDH23542.1 hypothetical protein SAMN04487974_1385 [Pelagibacterium luteolum]
MPSDRAYGRIPVEFPSAPFPTKDIFGAFITSFLPDNVQARTRRLANFELQLRWWRQMTDMPVHVVISNWTDSERDGCAELGALTERGGTITEKPAQPIILNRNACLAAFYASSHRWGIIMDDDAVLYHSPKHNSGGRFFAEMAAQPADAYDGIDVFFPINPAKMPGQNQIWKKDPQLYESSHVFQANYDLKGSMFIVRNFALEGKEPVLPPATFAGHGEDTLFAIEAISKGYGVFRCDNIVLKEFSGPSNFSHTRDVMKEGNQEIAQLYADQGLRMNQLPKPEHLLDRKEFLARCLPETSKQIVVSKP